MHSCCTWHRPVAHGRQAHLWTEARVRAPSGYWAEQSALQKCKRILGAQLDHLHVASRSHLGCFGDYMSFRDTKWHKMAQSQLAVPSNGTFRSASTRCSWTVPLCCLLLAALRYSTTSSINAVESAMVDVCDVDRDGGAHKEFAFDTIQARCSSIPLIKGLVLTPHTCTEPARWPVLSLGDAPAVSESNTRHSSDGNNAE
jgi:hypothetical protein